MRRSLLVGAFLLVTPLWAGEAPEIVNVKGYPSARAFTLEIVPGAAATEATKRTNRAARRIEPVAARNREPA